MKRSTGMAGYIFAAMQTRLCTRGLREIPDWMFESSWGAIGAVATPIVSSDALRDLQALLANVSGYDPILKEARCFEGGADAKETGSKIVSTWAVSAANTDAHVEGNALDVGEAIAIK